MGKVQSRGRKSRSGRYTKSSKKTQNKKWMTEDILELMERGSKEKIIMRKTKHCKRKSQKLNEVQTRQ